MPNVFNRRRRLGDQDSKSETHAMTAVNGAFDTVVDAETLEESLPAAEESGSSGITTRTEHYCLRVKSCVYTIEKKRLTVLCRALYGDAILVHSFGAPIWLPEINQNIWSSLFL